MLKPIKPKTASALRNANITTTDKTTTYIDVIQKLHKRNSIYFSYEIYTYLLGHNTILMSVLVLSLHTSTIRQNWLILAS
ncbi:hypothetical protein Vdis_0375 [Vulcanisaeta distributa DSM 14429]|uniref:Uncharacterized protein n=1 Tax=Vulcanisaeta distributa (strain DSM 14429 / JCM 11212 / NBRC 100878 / IC-017) TaxID=572478 RepID=E1QTY1_VULDI|nr:hypothetical protein Vdis_0375 [Vulcanisaeta distributa DSM 14429]